MNRTGIHITPDKKVGTQAPIRDCARFNCHPPFHNPDCSVIGMFPLDERLNQKPDESAPQKRVKRRTAEQE